MQPYFMGCRLLCIVYINEVVTTFFVSLRMVPFLKANPEKILFTAEIYILFIPKLSCTLL
jgi:hypothetical protein